MSKIYTPKIQKAIKFANQVHSAQTRKGKPNEAYILHPLGVGLILSGIDASEDQIVAGILHDTIEDCDPWGSITKEIIDKEFNSEVARMVNDVTEQDKNLPWAERKRLALEHMKEMKEDSLLVKSADVLHNLSDLLSDLEKDGEKAYECFSAPKEDIIKRFQNLLVELTKADPKNPLLPEIKKGVDKISKS